MLNGIKGGHLLLLYVFLFLKHCNAKPIRKSWDILFHQRGVSIFHGLSSMCHSLARRNVTCSVFPWVCSFLVKEWFCQRGSPTLCSFRFQIPYDSSWQLHTAWGVRWNFLATYYTVFCRHPFSTVATSTDTVNCRTYESFVAMSRSYFSEIYTVVASKIQ